MEMFVDVVIETKDGETDITLTLSDNLSLVIQIGKDADGDDVERLYSLADEFSTALDQIFREFMAL